jgi:hypothetical protein
MPRLTSVLSRNSSATRRAMISLASMLIGGATPDA